MPAPPANGAPPPRLFAALPLPESLRNEFFEAAGAIARLLPASRFRRVPPENLHLTLRFFGPETGALDRGRLAALLRERLAAHGPGQLTLRASGISTFGSPRRARVVWVGLAEVETAGDEPGRLLSLQGHVETVARAIGLAPERRRFVPHVTLGRFRVPTRLPAAALAVQPETPDSAWGSAFAAGEVGLFASVLTRDGAVYERLDRFPLAGR